MRKTSITEMDRLSVDQFRSSWKMPLTVVMDDVRSMYNVGSVFRTADAYRVERILLCGITACPPHAEIHKTALGAEDSVDWQHLPDALAAVRALQAQGYVVLAIEQAHGSTPLQQLPQLIAGLRAQRADGALRLAVVLGNEVKGVAQAVVDACDGCLELPQFGTKHSLNVSTTAGIVIWEMARQLLPEMQP
jgi:tRNA G18 (ribose-2'-O)-methylase SpoU